MIRRAWVAISSLVSLYINNCSIVNKTETREVRAHFGQSNFSFFQQKRKQEILLIFVIFTYFKVQTKIEK